MVFKKKPKKAAKKKNSKNAKKDDWTHEGGVTIAGQADENDENRLKRLHTQDKDESKRRSRRKHEDRKRKQHFINKMSKKIKFSDVLKSQEESDGEDKVPEPEVEEKPAKIPRGKNPVSAVDRLQMLFARQAPKIQDEEESSEEEPDSDDETVDSDDEIEEDEEENMDEDDEVEENADEDQGLVFGGAISTERVAEFDAAGEHDDSDDDAATYSKKADNGTPYDWFFHSTIADSALEKFANGKKKVKPQLVGSIDLDGEGDGNIYSITPDTTPKVSSKIDTVQQIPGIHKMWKSNPQPLTLNETSRRLMPHFLTYADTFIEGRDHKNDQRFLECLLMHTVFHVVKARAKVVRHNEKLKKKARDEALKKIESLGEEEQIEADIKAKRNKKKGKPAPVPTNDVNKTTGDEEDDAMKDQGFCRPRLLILCPYRSSAKTILKQICQILGENTSISGMEKFEGEYADPEESDDEMEYSKTGELKKRRKTDRPDDWNAIFDGNCDDDFKIGIQVNPGNGKGAGSRKGVYLRLFSDFYISDIVIASPLGLKLVMESSKKTKLDCDFLSSIEQVVIHQADVISMQNWEHLDFVMRHINQLPKTTHEDTDYGRVRPYFLEGHGAKHRQLLMTSAFNTPEIQSFFREFATSKAGQVRIKKHWGDGVVSQVAIPVKQTFQLVPAVSSADMQEEARFQYFKEHILNQILRLKQSRTVIVCPSYLQYVRIRNELIQQDASAVYICEYSRDSEISRGRARFYQGLKDIMVYSGRAHFFRRFKIRGARHVIFYSLPEYPHFYPEIVNMLGADTGGNNDSNNVSQVDMGEESSCLTMFTDYEKMALERVVGHKRAEHIFDSDKSTFLFF